MTAARPVTLRAADGATLHGRFHAASSARGVVVIAAAMAVPERLYQPLAEFLAATGYACLTFEYRGIGRSRAQPPGTRTDFYVWGEQDIGAAIRCARLEAPGVPCVLLGHSAGAQLAPLCDERDAIDAFVMVATGTAYWGHWPLPSRLALLAAWYLVVPLVTRLRDPLPGRLLGSSESVPAAVAAEWARCAREPAYLRGRHRRASDAGYDLFDPPALVWSISDDRYAPEAATRALVDAMPRLEPDWRRVAPPDLERTSVGHFGWFRGYSEPLWCETVAWLDRVIEPL